VTAAVASAASTAPATSGYATLVRLFWTLSMREPPGYLARQAGAKAVRRSTGWWIYLLYGLILLPGAISGMQAGVYSFYVNAAAFLLVGMAVAADFAGVIVAPGEDEILFHLPLKSRAYLAARVTVALLHTAVLATCFAILPVAFGAYRYGGVAYGGLLYVGVLLTATFALILSFVLYRVALRVLGGRRLRDLLAWLPPLIGLLFAFAPQVLLRTTASVRGWGTLPGEVLLVLPPAWFAALPEAVLGGTDDGARLRALVGVAALAGSAVVLVWALGRGLLADLQRLLATGEGSGPATAAERAGRLAPGPFALRALPLADGDAQAGYLLATGALRLREMRVRMASSLLMPFLILVLSTTTVRDAWYPGFGAVLLGMTTGTLLTLVIHHEHHAASWFYGALPLKRYGSFMSGVIGAVALRYVAPAFLLLATMGLFMTRDPWTLATMLFGGLAGALEVPIVARALRHAPFSLPPGPGAHKGLLLTFMGCLVLSAFVFGVGLALSYFSRWLLIAAIPLLGFVLARLLRGAIRHLDEWPPWTRPDYGK
jgi:hypothetical protein